ncbi:interleukin-24 isoform X2 [Peromyscus californicus insignis]|uniref:interleukin-24 isoform X2 n=1 Tax=Peromyscus californicus insignis TaxID=564181 RepID=UPI0022A7FAB1|nr:interleukin-24 isoform X2 [Peromyscus californicus insignis]
MSSILQTLSCLSLILLVWNQVPGLQGHEFRFGPCRVEGVVLSELWEAFSAMKNTVQTQDDITSVRLLKSQVLHNVSKDEDMLSISESAHRRFLLFRKAFKQMDTEAALVKAFGEVDILLTWMQNFYQL